MESVAPLWKEEVFCSRTKKILELLTNKRDLEPLNDLENSLSRRTAPGPLTEGTVRLRTPDTKSVTPSTRLNSFGFLDQMDHAVVSRGQE